MASSLVEMIDAWAKENGCTRNAAISRLCLLGLGNPLADAHPGLAFRINEGVAGLKQAEKRVREGATEAPKASAAPKAESRYRVPLYGSFGGGPRPKKGK